MKDVRAKRAFLIALAAAMALITLLYAGRSVDREMAVERQYPRKNAALSMHLEQGGVIRIEGEGKLYYNDLKAMLRQADIKTDDVRDVIVGDGIDEIGYLTFNHLKSLRTLKLGSGVRRGEGRLRSARAGAQHVRAHALDRLVRHDPRYRRRKPLEGHPRHNRRGLRREG